MGVSYGVSGKHGQLSPILQEHITGAAAADFEDHAVITGTTDESGTGIHNNGCATALVDVGGRTTGGNGHNTTGADDSIGCRATTGDNLETTG